MIHHLENRSPQNGFSLLEMLIALAIFSVISAVAFQYIQTPTPSERLSEAKRDVAQFLQRARQDAINRGQIEKIRIIAANGEIRSRSRKADLTLNEVVSLSSTTAKEVFSLAGGTAGSEIWFFTDGSSTGGSIELSAGDQKVLLKVSWLTGFIESSNIR